MRDDDDLPIFRPRMGRRGRPAQGKSASFRDVLLSQIRSTARRGARRNAARLRVGVSRPGADARRVIVKAHFVRLTPTGAKAASLHLRYVQRDGVEKDGSKGILYDAQGPAVSESFERPRADENHQFRLIVSPEDAAELDLTAFVRRFMARVERDTGRRLEWGAVNHYNTDHPHAHVIVRGVDRDGREVRFDRAYVSHGLRARAQEIATEELGPRQEHDIQRIYAKETAHERFTSLDRELERRACEGRVQMRSGRSAARIQEDTLVARLEYLTQVGLAERLSSREWSLTHGWQERLRELGARGDIIKQIHRAVSGDPARYYGVRVGQSLPTDTPGEPMTGRVADKGLSDELKGRFYAVVETPTGSAYHVPLDARSADSLRLGDLVSLTSRPEHAVRPIDRHIAETARAHGGVYETPHASSSDAHRANPRIRELERIGLATPEGPGRWTVAPNLLEALERQGQADPARYRLHVRPQSLSLDQQVSYQGPVWLDRLDASALAPYGFGAEVHRALQRRRDVLRSLGLTPEDPSRTAKLHELERQGVARSVAENSGQTFVSRVPDGWRGSVRTISTGSGLSYAVVSDGSRFAVLRTNAALRANEGKVVVFSFRPDGRPVVRPDPGRDLGS